MDSIRKGWFSELNDAFWPGQCFSLKVKEVLHLEKSDYQEIMVLETERHGNALVLDGVIQCTEFDEFSYQEMITHLPLHCHPNPKKVLIVGGGDGGVAREVTKHGVVDEVVQVEIDAKVVEASKRHLPRMRVGFESPKLHLVIGDGLAYLAGRKAAFDVIITDSSDPIGPAVELFREPYFGLLREALRPGGVICNQVGNLWNDLDFIATTMGHCARHFGEVRYAHTSVPTYPYGQIGFIVATPEAGADLHVPKRLLGEEAAEEMKLRYYNSEVHASAFVLPTFARKRLPPR